MDEKVAVHWCTFVQLIIAWMLFLFQKWSLLRLRETGLMQVYCIREPGPLQVHIFETPCITKSWMSCQRLPLKNHISMYWKCRSLFLVHVNLIWNFCTQTVCLWCLCFCPSWREFGNNQVFSYNNVQIFYFLVPVRLHCSFMSEQYYHLKVYHMCFVLSLYKYPGTS
jgi:hypothetical protein